MPWYQSKYAKAAAVATATGLVTALIVWLGIFDDPTIAPKTAVKIVGLSFMAPFATLIRFLPSFQDIFGPAPQVSVQNAPNMTLNTEAPPPAPPSDRPAIGKGPRALK